MEEICFLVSFMVDARGGAMRGCRHSGVRMIIPPGMASQPTRVTCRLVKKEKLLIPPPLMEGEALASRVIELGPANAQFLGPVIIEMPHFASLRGREREIVVLRSNNGEKWAEHTLEASDDLVQQILHDSFEEVETAEELAQKRITRIVTTEFPQYFAIISRVRQETKQIGAEGGVISSTVVPQVQAVFPEGALTKNIKVGLQAQPVNTDLITKMFGNRVAVSPIVTVEPRRRKFHKSITLTIPVPKAAQKGMINQYGGDAPTLRLLYSITGGTQPAQWEDITGSTPLTFVDNCVSFTTTVSARFWLMDCQNITEASRMATELYRESMSIPFMSKFVVFAKRHEEKEARLRAFCMTDDKMDKTLETQEHFIEVARSRDVEVHEGKPQFIEMAGNLVPVTKSGEQLYINFHAFRENRLPFVVRIRDDDQDPVGRIAFMKEPKVARGEAPQMPICNLNVSLPEYTGPEALPTVDAKTILKLREKYTLIRTTTTTETYLGAELRLTQISDAVQDDWVQLADELQVPSSQVQKCRTEFNTASDQCLYMLHSWAETNGSQATGNELERALRKIGRDDVVMKCMYNVHEVTDDVEKAMAKMQIEQSAGFDELQAEVKSRDSTMQRGASLDVSYDEQDLVKESESAAEESESDHERESYDEESRFVRRVGDEVDEDAVDQSRRDRPSDDVISRMEHMGVEATRSTVEQEPEEDAEFVLQQREVTVEAAAPTMAEPQEYERDEKEGEAVDETSPEMKDLIDRLAEADLKQQEEQAPEAPPSEEFVSIAEETRFTSVTTGQEVVEQEVPDTEQIPDVSPEEAPPSFEEARYEPVMAGGTVVEGEAPYTQQVPDITPEEATGSPDEERFEPVMAKDTVIEGGAVETQQVSDISPVEAVPSPEEERFEPVMAKDTLIEGEVLETEQVPVASEEASPSPEEERFEPVMAKDTLIEGEVPETEQVPVASPEEAAPSPEEERFEPLMPKDTLIEGEVPETEQVPVASPEEAAPSPEEERFEPVMTKDTLIEGEVPETEQVPVASPEEAVPSPEEERFEPLMAKDTLTEGEVPETGEVPVVAPEEAASSPEEERFEPVMAKDTVTEGETVETQQVPDISPEEAVPSPEEERFETVMTTESLVEGEKIASQELIDEYQPPTEQKLDTEVTEIAQEVSEQQVTTEQLPEKVAPESPIEVEKAPIDEAGVEFEPQGEVEDLISPVADDKQFAERAEQRYPLDEQEYTEELIDEQFEQMEEDQESVEEEIIEEEVPEEEVASAPGTVTRKEVIETEPETATDVQEIEEVLPDGTVVTKKKKVPTATLR